MIFPLLPPPQQKKIFKKNKIKGVKRETKISEESEVSNVKGRISLAHAGSHNLAGLYPCYAIALHAYPVPNLAHPNIG